MSQSNITSTTNGSLRNNQRLPLWAKAIIAFTALGFCLIVAFSIMTYVCVYPQFLNCGKPENINKVAAHIAGFSPYPPAGFKFITGLELFNIYTLVAEHLPPDPQSIFLISYPIVQGDPAAIVDAISANSAPQFGTHFNSIISRGELQVAHEKMPYIIGNVSDQGRGSQAMFGCLVLHRRTICVLILSPSGTSFSFKDAVQFLGCIEKFN